MYNKNIIIKHLKEGDNRFLEPCIPLVDKLLSLCLQLISWALGIWHTLSWHCEMTYSLWSHNMLENIDMGTGAMLQWPEPEFKGGRSHWRPTQHQEDQNPWNHADCFYKSEGVILIFIYEFGTLSFEALCLRVSYFNVVWFWLLRKIRRPSCEVKNEYTDEYRRHSPCLGHCNLEGANSMCI